MSYIVDPQYTCKIEKPKDFDVFWKGVTDQLIDIPLNPEIYADPLRSSPSVEVLGFSTIVWTTLRFLVGMLSLGDAHQ